MKKKVIAATLAAMMVASLTACGAPKQLSKSVTVELGNEKGINIADILDISKDKVKDAKLNTKKVDFFKTGEYDATITYDKKDYSVKVKIKLTQQRRKQQQRKVSLFSRAQCYMLQTVLTKLLSYQETLTLNLRQSQRLKTLQSLQSRFQTRMLQQFTR